MEIKYVNLVVFSLVAVLHLWRAIVGLPLNIGTFLIPVWGSYLAAIVIGGLAYWNYRS